MSRRLLYIITCALTLASCGSQRQATEESLCLAPDELNGRVKSVTLMRQELCYPERFFQNIDETTELFYTGPDEAPIEKYYYDKKGHLTKIDHYTCKGDGIEIYYTASYDRKGNKTEQVAFEDGLFIKTVYEYDHLGKCGAETKYNELGEECASITHTYREDGQIAYSLYQEPKGNLMLRCTGYLYDEKGFCIKKEIFETYKDGSRDTLDTYVYENDERGNHLKITHSWYLCEAPETEEFTYNERNQVLTHTYGDMREEIRYHSTLGREYTRYFFLEGREIGHTTYIYNWKTMNWDLLSFAYTDEKGKTHIFAEWIREIEYY